MISMKFIGSGSGLVSPNKNYHSNVLIRKGAGNKYLAIDCGTHFQLALEHSKINVNDIDSIFISHLHADHVGGLEWIGFKRFFVSPFGETSPRLIGNIEVLEELWEHTLSGGMRSLQGKENSLSTYFKITKIPPNGGFLWANTKFDLVQTVHVVDDRRIMPSYGLLFNSGDKKIFFTGDTQFCPNQILTYYNYADIIFQDCELLEYPQSVHAQYHELLTLPIDIRKKMWLYHYGEQEIPTDWKSMGFHGFVKRGQEFTF